MRVLPIVLAAAIAGSFAIPAAQAAPSATGSTVRSGSGAVPAAMHRRSRHKARGIKSPMKRQRLRGSAQVQHPDESTTGR
jgi:hypothetical protein